MSYGTMARAALFAFSCSMIATAGFAENLIYRPINPGLGGNPNTYDYLIGLAEIQNQHLTTQSGSGGSAPAFSFPPITIDLGGVGATPADPAAGDPAPAVQP